MATSTERLITVLSDAEFQKALVSAEDRLVVVDFFADELARGGAL